MFRLHKRQIREQFRNRSEVLAGKYTTKFFYKKDSEVHRFSSSYVLFLFALAVSAILTYCLICANLILIEIEVRLF